MGEPMAHFWQVPDIDKLWPPGETVATINPCQGAFDSYTSYIAASVERSIHAIETHPTLTAYRDLVPRLCQFAVAICEPEQTETLDDTAYVVAHKDMHFANIMCDPTLPNKMPIMAVLDWEFAGIVPASRWNPPKAFLWNVQQNGESKPEKERLFSILKEILQHRAPRVLEEIEPNERQGAIQAVQSYLRAIVDVCPHEQRADMVDSWRAIVEVNLKTFGV
ncbi:hypothetical protein HK405_006233 [Cladochytrium tenue]|nr:hypothetical protein HK405_006233 [Cladochytrium tenue]